MGQRKIFLALMAVEGKMQAVQYLFSFSLGFEITSSSGLTGQSSLLFLTKLGSVMSKSLRMVSLTFSINFAVFQVHHYSDHIHNSFVIDSPRKFDQYLSSIPLFFSLEMDTWSVGKLEYQFHHLLLHQHDTSLYHYSSLFFYHCSFDVPLIHDISSLQAVGRLEMIFFISKTDYILYALLLIAIRQVYQIIVVILGLSFCHVITFASQWSLREDEVEKELVVQGCLLYFMSTLHVFQTINQIDIGDYPSTTINFPLPFRSTLPHRNIFLIYFLVIWVYSLSEDSFLDFTTKPAMHSICSLNRTRMMVD